jgi:enoyl reductase-like protein
MDCLGVIDFTTEKSVHFVPRYDQMFQVWMTVQSLEQLQQKNSGIDEVRYSDTLEDYIK